MGLPIDTPHTLNPGDTTPWLTDPKTLLGIMEKKMEATTIYWCYMGIMEKKMETTIL